MKRIILAALLAASSVAHAESIAYLNNNAGGKIVLATNPCYINGERFDPLLSAWTHTKSGVVITGCWMYEDATNLVHIVWEDGERRVYPSGNFQRLKP